LTYAQEAEVVRLIAQGASKDLLAVQFGVHYNTIGNTLKRAKEKAPASDQARGGLAATGAAAPFRFCMYFQAT
jgi:transposase